MSVRKTKKTDLPNEKDAAITAATEPSLNKAAEETPSADTEKAPKAKRNIRKKPRKKQKYPRRKSRKEHRQEQKHRPQAKNRQSSTKNKKKILKKKTLSETAGTVSGLRMPRYLNLCPQKKTPPKESKKTTDTDIEKITSDINEGPTGFADEALPTKQTHLKIT